MSVKAVMEAVGVTGLTPAQKLTYISLAFVASEDRPDMKPSSAWLSKMTGLAPGQANRAVNDLARLGHITKSDHGWRLAAPKEATEALPSDWWPSERAIDTIHAAYPDHDFDMKETVSDFIEFTQRRRIAIPADDRDGAFVRNVCGFLARLPAGKVQIGNRADREATRSIGAFLAGR